MSQHEESEEVVDYVVHITSLRDMKLLAFSLLKGVVDLLRASDATIITYSYSGKILNSLSYAGEDYSIQHGSNDVPEHYIKACETLRSSKNTSRIKIGNTNTFAKPLFSNREFQQYLIFTLATELSSNHANMLSGFFSIYSNFLSLLKESQTDELTGLANRKTFDSAISSVFKERPLCVSDIENERRLPYTHTTKNSRYWLAIVDIDNFKFINDNYGHLYGDEILILMAQLIRENFRHEDLQFRFGGEEFVILLHAESRDVCETVLERFRLSVASHAFPNQQNITVSIGVVEFKKDVFHVTSIDYADQALYNSKSKGKNRVTYFEDMVAEGTASIPDVEGGKVELF